LILGLPGETLDSHLTALKTLLDSNIHQMHNFQAMMLKGSEMETLATRQMFGFDTRFRVLPRNFGVIDERRVLDVEEIIVATDTLPFDDYVTCRKWHLISSVFWNDGWFEPVVRFVRAHGITNSEWWSRMLPALENGGPIIRGFLDRFIRETVGELFPTPESCTEFYCRDENFAKLELGEIGDNLMYRYRAIASFHVWDAVCATALAATRQLFEERGILANFQNFDQFWNEFHKYVRLSHASGRTPQEILSSAEAVLSYDFTAWLADGELHDPEKYRLPAPARFVFELTHDGRREMERSLALYTTHVRGLSKLVTRIKVDAQVRTCRRLWSLPQKPTCRRERRSSSGDLRPSSLS